MSSFEEKTSPLLQGLQLAMSRQGKKKFSGSSEDDLVRIQINGKHEIQEVEVADLGLSGKKHKALEEAIREAAEQAIGKAQRSAKKDIEAGAKGESRGKK